MMSLDNGYSKQPLQPTVGSDWMGVHTVAVIGAGTIGAESLGFAPNRLAN